MVRFFKDNKGMIQPFKIVQGDGVTAKNLSGLTIVWRFTDRLGNNPAGSPIAGTITDAANGLVEFTIPSGMFTAETAFITQINLTDGAAYDEDTDPFNVDIEDPTSR